MIVSYMVTASRFWLSAALLIMRDRKIAFREMSDYFSVSPHVAAYDGLSVAPSQQYHYAAPQDGAADYTTAPVILFQLASRILAAYWLFLLPSALRFDEIEV